MKPQLKQYAVCNDTVVLIDSLPNARIEAEKLLEVSPDKTFYITEVIGKVSNGVQWDMKRTRKTKIRIPVDSQKNLGGGTQ